MRKICQLLLNIVLLNTYIVQAQKTYIDTAGMDNTINPGDNFYMYVNGGWIKKTTIPNDRNSWGNWGILEEETEKKLRTTLEDAYRNNHPKGSLLQKVGDFYASGMDTINIERQGYKPLKKTLSQIDRIKNKAELLQFITSNYPKNNIKILLLLGVYPDQKNSSKSILYLAQTGLTLPDKEYYFDTSQLAKQQRIELVNYVKQIFQLVNINAATAEKNATEVLNLETSIAHSHFSPVELRDPIKNFNKISIKDLQKKLSHIDWLSLFKRMNIQTDSVNLMQPSYYETLDSLIDITPISTWKNKLKFDYISTKVPLLSKAFQDVQFKFNQIFSGQKKQLERWRSMVKATEENLRDLLGQLYTYKYFPPEAKKRTDSLIINLQKAFSLRLNKSNWLSDSTIQNAKAKLGAIRKNVGYPNRWDNFNSVTISPKNYFDNYENIAQYQYKGMIAKLKKQADTTAWDMPTTTVNAYYDPTINQIVFPAGILQFPFFDLNADDAINYGAIGVVIGHEIIHGFDDQGSQYDKNGNLRFWWTTEDIKKFKIKSKALINQYNQYVLIDTIHINGELTLGENIADLGGMIMAYEAFKMTPQGRSQQKIDGFTPDQRFFLSYARSRKKIVRIEKAMMFLKTNPHAPEMYRVNGPLSNFEPFYKAFNITEKDKMYRKPEDRVTIW